MFPPLQKQLAWLQRFLYNIASGDFPFPQPTIDIGQDWPLDVRRIGPPNFTTVVGALSATLFASDAFTHALVFALAVNKVTAGVLPNDSFTFGVTASNGTLGIPMYQHLDVTGMDLIPLIGCQAQIAAASASRVGLSPIYVPPNESLFINWTSVAGGLDIQTLGLAVVRPLSYPLRLP